MRAQAVENEKIDAVTDQERGGHGDHDRDGQRNQDEILGGPGEGPGLQPGACLDQQLSRAEPRQALERVDIRQFPRPEFGRRVFDQ